MARVMVGGETAANQWRHDLSDAISLPVPRVQKDVHLGRR
jgi:hypothetical protein